MARRAPDPEITEVLGELGFGEPSAQRAARSALEKAGLTHARKTRISEEKLPRVRELLDATFARACADEVCRGALRRQKPGSELLAVIEPRACEYCGGSDNRKAMRRLVAACLHRGVSRVVVVGGSPSVRDELEHLKPDGWQLRLIDGTERRTQDKAKADLEWAQLVLVWGASELDHKVSRLYTDSPSASRRKVVTVAKRGIAALLNAGADHLERAH